MTIQTQVTTQGYVRSPFRARRRPSSSLHVVWNCLRRVSRRTDAGVVDTLYQPSGPSSYALFDIRIGRSSRLRLNDQISCSLSSLNFTPSQCADLSSRITSFTVNFAAGRSGQPYSGVLIFAHVNFIELPDDDIHGSVPRQLPFRFYVAQDFMLRSPAVTLGGAAEDGKGGVSDSALEKLRRTKFARRGEEESCSVCLETFSDGVEIISLSCDHFYHGSCIVRWLMRRRTCPLCRQEIFTNNVNHS